MSESAFIFGRGLLSVLLVAAMTLPRPSGECCRADSQEPAVQPTAACCQHKPATSAEPSPALGCFKRVACNHACCQANEQGLTAARSLELLGQFSTLAISSATVEIAPQVDGAAATYLAGAPICCDIPHRILHCSWII